MGLDKNSLKFISAGAPLGDTLTLGRQDAMVDGCSELYAESLLGNFGATRVSSVDASDFEGAYWIHDLNTPIPKSEHEKYDTVIDGGTLEHIFNLPVALKNCMEMVKKGGRLIIDTPTNNWCGHGFYQFSPELFFGVFSEDNGYWIERMVIHRVGSSKWYDVVDPHITGKRTELMSVFPMTLKVMARRINVFPIFRIFPQQSDYVARWEGRVPWVHKPRPWYSVLKTIYDFSRMNIRNRDVFRPISK